MLVVEEGKEAPTEKQLKSYPFKECIFLDLCASFAAILQWFQIKSSKASCFQQMIIFYDLLKIYEQI